MTEKILVLGCSGQVGNELVRFICPEDFIIIGLSHADADITKKNDISNIIKNSGCSLVINAAAFTEVDIAEKKRNLAYKINEKGTYNVGEACRNAGIPLIHISTDYVFDGNKKTGFIEDDLVNPLGAYGASKNAGEFVLREVLKEHIILRTSWVYSSTGKNFVKTILRLGNEREEISVVDDQYGCPTSAHEIAQVIIEMACQIIFNGKKDKWGTYHYCGDTKMTWYGFACEIFNVVSLQRTGGSTQTVEDVASQGKYLIRTLNRTGLLNNTDSEVLNAANFLLGKFKDALIRFDNLTVDLTEATTSNQNTVLDREVGDVVKVELTPPGSGSPAQITSNEIIDSINSLLPINFLD